LLEPQPELFDALRKTYAHRPDLILVNAAVAGHDGSITMHRVRPTAAPEQWVTGTASLRPDMLETIRPQVSNLDGMTETISVRAVTPQTVLREHGIGRFDLLQIDTQGFDYEVIKLFEVEESRPAVIHFEHDMLAPQVWEECIERLIACGYQVAHTFEDTLACRKDVFPQG
jgi:FkbM family methyltransferase